jgi:DNA-binding CsgD family transcriptional regulator
VVRISTATAGFKRTLPMAKVGELIAAIGTGSYGSTCLNVLDELYGVEHWALFRYRADGIVHCVASASRIHVAAAQANVRQFINRCHRVDPSLIALRQRQAEHACVAEMQIGDIRDRQYRQCFETAGVKECISFFVRPGMELNQLSIYRGTRNASLSSAGIESFAELASVIMRSGKKHEELSCVDSRAHELLTVDSIEQLLRLAPLGLSQRESEVCARAAAGSTIVDTAADLNIKSTSVITYRQRAYEKLNISRQSELLALVHQLRPAKA